MRVNSFLTGTRSLSHLNWRLDRRLDIVGDDFQGIQFGIKQLRDAIKQAEYAPYQQQVYRNAAHALTELHSGIYSLYAVACLFIAKQHTDKLQQGRDIHLLVELKPGAR